MATKNNPGKYDCYAAAEPDEPIFVLRANDPDAGASVRGWAWNRVNKIFQGQKPNTPEQWAKVSEALQCATDMDAWNHQRHCVPAIEAAAEQLKEQLKAAGVEVRQPPKPVVN